MSISNVMFSDWRFSASILFITHSVEYFNAAVSITFFANLRTTTSVSIRKIQPHHKETFV